MTLTSLANISGVSHGDVCQKIDEEIAQLESRLSSLRSFRNSLSPTCKIPIEILSKIFTQTQESDVLGYPDDIDLRTRLIISWVCRHWRDIALETPSLWTVIQVLGKRRIPNYRVDFVQELLARSRNQGLAVFLQTPSHEISQTFLAHTSRIHHLRIRWLDCDRDSREVFAQTVPSLVSLELRNLLNLLPVSLFSGVYPRLRHFTTDDIALLTRSTAPPPNLTTLRIFSGRGFVLRSLLELLPSLPNLTELELIECLREGDIIQPIQRFALPNLQALSLADNKYSAMFDFFNSLDIPQAEIAVTWPAQSFAMPENDRRAFCTTLTAYLEQTPFPIRHFAIRSENLDEIDFNFIVEFSASHQENCYRFEFPMKQPIFTDTDMFLMFALPLDNIESLELPYLPQSIIPTLAGLPKLKAITLTSYNAFWRFVEAFDVNPGDMDIRPFPVLKEIVIDGVDFENESEDVSVGRFDEVLRNRHAAGFGLEELVFVACGDVPVDIERFTGFVTVVRNLV